MLPANTDTLFPMSKPLNNISLLKTIITILFLAPLFLSVSFFYSGIHSASFASVYEIGDDKPYGRLSELDWNGLKPGDLVKIYVRSRPYAEKLVLSCSGLSKKPIIIRGIPDENGNKPIIEGNNAVHFQKLCQEGHYDRGLIVLGDCNPADYILIENLEIRNANNKAVFSYRNTKQPYAKNAAGIFVWKGRDVRIRNCEIHSCGMGILTNHYPNTDLFYLGGSFIHNNGDFTQTTWGHNVYIQARKTLIEFNRFGELFSDGNNIKDRSNMTIIRYNWIAGGMSRQVDLVENNAYRQQNALVYGNFITHGKSIKNPKMILFGGDIIDKNKQTKGSRSGTLQFFNNTVVSKVKTEEPFVYINRLDCMAVLKNNIMIGRPKVFGGSGRVLGTHNFFSYNTDAGTFQNSYYGSYEHFISQGNIDYIPRFGSILINRGTKDVPASVDYMPTPFPKTGPRPKDKMIDIGAFEFFKQPF